MKRLVIASSLLSLVACSQPIRTVSTDGQTAHIRLHTSLTTGTDMSCERAVYEARRYMQRTGSSKLIVVNTGYVPFKSADKQTLNAMED